MKFFRKLTPMFILALILQLISPAIFSDKVEINAAANGPVVLTMNASKYVQGNPLRPIIELTFDENITKQSNTSSVKIYKMESNQLVTTIPITNNSIAVSGSLMTITTNVNLEYNTNYILVVEASTVKNASGQTLQTNYQNNFTTVETADIVKPTYTGIEFETCPINTGTGNFNTSSCTTSTELTNINAVNTAIRLKFSEPVYTGTGTIVLKATDNSDTRNISLVSSEVQGGGTSAITIRPSQALLANKTYNVTISSTNFKDAANNNLQTNYTTSNFKTAATDAIVATISPTKGATNVALNTNRTLTFSIDFNENVTPVNTKKIRIYTVNGNLQIGSDIAVTSGTRTGNKFTYTSAALTANTEYYILVDSQSFASQDGINLYRGHSNTTSWKFRTKASADTQAPILKTKTPESGATNVPRNELIILKFDEPVYASNGTIVIREYNSNSVYRTISVSSVRVTGSGTDTITIDPHKAIPGEVLTKYNENTRYYVEIPAGAFKDQSDNASVAITGKNGYNFTVGQQATSKPLLTKLTPLNGTETIPSGSTQTFILEFDRDVSINGTADSARIYLKNSTSTSTGIELSASQEAGKSKQVKLSIAGTGSLDENKDYYINVPNNLIQDVNGSYYDGILNTYQWTFKTLGGDKVAPKIIRAESNGNKIRIVFDELLKENAVPAIGYFFVTVNGMTKNISSLAVEKNAVILTMYDAITANQPVLVSYTKPATNPVQDLTGNALASFSNQEVIYGSLTTVPAVIASSYSGKNITLEFNEPLQKINALSYLQFSVQAEGVNNAVTTISQNGTKLTLGVTTSIPSNRNVVVNYNKGAYPLQGYINDVNSFTLKVGQGSTTVVTGGEPAVTSITASGNTIVITYNQAVSIAPSSGQYTVTVNGSTKSVTDAKLDGQTVTLTLSSAVQTTDAVKVSYTTSGRTLFSTTTTGVYAPSFQNVTATVGAAPAKIALQSGILKGDQITLGFTKPIDTKALPKPTQFYVMVAGNNWEVRQVYAEGSNLVLKLPRSVSVGVAATVSYFTTEDTLRATDGERVSTISSYKLANQTTLIDILPNEFAALPTGVLLKDATAVRSTTTSPSGKSVTQYTINNTSIQSVVDAVSTTTTNNIEIRFEVPTSEAAAVVAFPVAALQNASKKGKFTFSVKYGDVYYEVPTESVDISTAVTMNKGSAYTNNLVLKIETGSNGATRLLESSISSNGSNLVSGPYLFEATIDGPSGSSQVPLKGNLIRKVVVPKVLTKEQTGAVFYDEVAGNISGVPTTFKVNGSNTEVTFMRPGSSAYAIVSSNKTFTDTKGHWAEYSILTLTRKSIIEGHTATKFAPQVNITRGEFATYLVKGLGLSADKEAAKKFTDVNANSALGGYIGAAYKAGIVSGVSATQFKPNAYITREDMAIMMMRLVAYTKMDVNLTNSPNNYISQFTDGNKVSSYARTQVGQAIQIGIITGSTPTTISPLSNATRAEGITMIDRVLRKANYLQ